MKYLELKYVILYKKKLEKLQNFQDYIYLLLLVIRMQSRAPSKVSEMFCGTQDKCHACNKTVYPLEKVTQFSQY